MAYCAVSNPHRVRIFEVLPSGLEARWGSDRCEASKADYMLRVDSTNSKLWVHHENRPEQEILLMDLSLNVGDTFDIVRYALDGITNGVVARPVVVAIDTVNNRKVLTTRFCTVNLIRLRLP